MRRVVPQHHQKVLSQQRTVSKKAVTGDDPFEGEVLHDLEVLIIDRFDAPLTATEFIAAEDNREVCRGLVDSSNPNWRSDLHEELLGDEIEDELLKMLNLEDNELSAGKQDAEYDNEVRRRQLKQCKKRWNLVMNCKNLLNFNGHQELLLAMSRMNVLLSQIKLSSLQQQTKIDDYFPPI